jgi:hypothetical protein
MQLINRARHQVLPPAMSHGSDWVNGGHAADIADSTRLTPLPLSDLWKFKLSSASGAGHEAKNHPAAVSVPIVIGTQDRFACRITLIIYNAVRWNTYPRAVWGLRFPAAATSSRFGAGAVTFFAARHA